MKHIKKKFLFEIPTEKLNTESHLFDAYDTDELLKRKKLPDSKNMKVIISLTSGISLQAYIHRKDGNSSIIPLPNIVLVNFDFAYRLNSTRKECVSKILKNNSNSITFSETSQADIYALYGTSSSCIISLFTTIESFLNTLIPDDGIYNCKKNNRFEAIYNKNQIERYLSFEDKINSIIPFFNNRRLFKTHNIQDYNQILNLKQLRDELIHVKSDKNGENSIKILTNLIDFNYEKTFLSVKNFINFYSEGLIEDCPCSIDD